MSLSAGTHSKESLFLANLITVPDSTKLLKLFCCWPRCLFLLTEIFQCLSPRIINIPNWSWSYHEVLTVPDKSWCHLKFPYLDQEKHLTQQIFFCAKNYAITVFRVNKDIFKGGNLLLWSRTSSRRVPGDLSWYCRHGLVWSLVQQLC